MLKLKFSRPFINLMFKLFYYLLVNATLFDEFYFLLYPVSCFYGLRFIWLMYPLPPNTIWRYGGRPGQHDPG